MFSVCLRECVRVVSVLSEVAPGSGKTNWPACLRRLSISRRAKLMWSPELRNSGRVGDAAWFAKMCTHFDLLDSDCTLISQLHLNSQTSLYWSILAACVLTLKRQTLFAVIYALLIILFIHFYFVLQSLKGCEGELIPSHSFLRFCFLQFLIFVVIQEVKRHH